MKFLHVRHATSLLTYAGSKILIDPVFGEAGQYPPVPLTPNQRNNPLIDLCTPLETLLDIDMVLSTHTHRDHFDDRAREVLDKGIDLVCQPADRETFKGWGFTHLHPVEQAITIREIRVVRVPAYHGTGEIGERMGPCCGYILSAQDEPTLYITGDTVFHDSIRETIRTFHPDLLIINAGAPQFLNSDPIVMNIGDVEETLKIDPALTFIIVHLDAFNHCIERRDDLRKYFTPARLANLGVTRFIIPEENEEVDL